MPKSAHLELPRPSLGSLRRRFAQRPDSEHGQALVRLVVLTVVLVYLLLRGPDGEQATQYSDVLAMVATGCVIGVGIMAGIVMRPGASHLRRALGMVSDYGLMAAEMIRLGEPLAWVYVILMWVTVGNGLSYGNRYLSIAVGMAMLSFGSGIALTPYWALNRSLASACWSSSSQCPRTCRACCGR